MMDNTSEIKSGQARSMLMKVCSTKEMCRNDLEKKMDKWGLDTAEQGKILKYLEKEGFYSDRRFAESFVNDKFKLQKWGRVKIKYALRAKSISEEIINELLTDTKEYDYTGKLEELLNKKFLTLKPSGSKQQTKARLFRFAAGRGFEPELIFRLINKLVGD